MASSYFIVTLLALSCWVFLSHVATQEVTSPLYCGEECSGDCRLLADCRTCTDLKLACLRKDVVEALYEKNSFKDDFCGSQGVVVYWGQEELLPVKCGEGGVCPNMAICRRSQGQQYCCAQVVSQDPTTTTSTIRVAGANEPQLSSAYELVNTTSASENTGGSGNTTLKPDTTLMKSPGSSPQVETTETPGNSLMLQMSGNENGTLTNETSSIESKRNRSSLMCPQSCSEEDGRECRLVASCKECRSTFKACMRKTSVDEIFEKNLFREDFCGPQGVVIYSKEGLEYLPFKCQEGGICPDETVCRASFTDEKDYCCAQVNNGGLVAAFSSGNADKTKENVAARTYPPYVTYENQTYSLVIDHFTTPVPVTGDHPKLSFLNIQDNIQDNSTTQRQTPRNTTGQPAQHGLNPGGAHTTPPTSTPIFSLHIDIFTTLFPIEFDDEGNPRPRRSTDSTKIKNTEPEIGASKFIRTSKTESRIDGERISLSSGSDSVNISLESNETLTGLDDVQQNSNASQSFQGTTTKKAQGLNLFHYIATVPKNRDRVTKSMILKETTLTSKMRITEVPTPQKTARQISSTYYETPSSTPVTYTNTESSEVMTSALESTFSTMGTESSSFLETSALEPTFSTLGTESSSSFETMTDTLFPTTPTYTNTKQPAGRSSPLLGTLKNSPGFAPTTLRPSAGPITVGENQLSRENNIPLEAGDRGIHSRRKRSYRYETREKIGSVKKEKPDCISTVLRSAEGDWNSESLLPPATKLRPDRSQSTISAVLVLEQFSEVECLEDVTFFYMKRILLVSDGCSALFLVCFRTSKDLATPTGTPTSYSLPAKMTPSSSSSAAPVLKTTTTATQVISGIINQGCHSIILRSSLYRTAQARFVNSESISSMSLIRQFSSRACVRGVNFGFDASLASASQGCRGEFRICQGQATPSPTLSVITTTKGHTTPKLPVSKTTEERPTTILPVIETTEAKASTSQAPVTTEKPTCKLVALMSTESSTDSYVILDDQNRRVKITRVVLVHEMSKLRCDPQKTFNFDGSVVTAQDGCAGNFAVCFASLPPKADTLKPTPSTTKPTGSSKTATVVSTKKPTTQTSPASKGFSTPEPKTTVNVNSTKGTTEKSQTEKAMTKEPQETEPTTSTSTTGEPTDLPPPDPDQSEADRTITPTNQTQSDDVSPSMPPGNLPSSTINNSDATRQPSSKPFTNRGLIARLLYVLQGSFRDMTI